MKNWLSEMNAISLKKERLIIGLMSGTSLDGLDIALCKIEGTGLSTKVSVIAFQTIPYTDAFRDSIKKICFVKSVDLEQVCLLNSEIGRLHGTYINQFLRDNNIDAKSMDLIASHGQTIFHSPKRLREEDYFSNATLQIGDADQIACVTGITTVADFRQKHIAQGKEGAPLAIYGDYLLFSNNAENRIFLNIGGIANFTLLKKEATFDDLLSTDTGPGNTLMDQYVYKNFEGKRYDKNAEIALGGTVNVDLLNALLDHPFFENELPKTTGPELFNLEYLYEAIRKANLKMLSHEDVMATLNRFTACGIANAIKQTQLSINSVIYISGGGIHNSLLTNNLKELLPSLSFKNIETLGINPDAKEALLFAILANETIAGDYRSFGDNALSLGKISLPK
ncbi:anhydro-N-acetylmuramic acid kinase [Pedobacter alpinus]|uniref:Anhydro-N-acetylmuramic acid kinase n=1 Tax=Pedobacter alpinus TaxID=1590643 RepID=A0ABW5TS91_9SPHI